MKTTHNHDSDCAGHIDADGTCGICGVYHGDPCGLCGGRGFHAEGCAELFDRGSEEYKQIITQKGKNAMNILDQIQAIADSGEYDLAYRADYAERGMLAFETTIPPGSGPGQQLRALGLQVNTLGLSWIYSMGKV